MNVLELRGNCPDCGVNHGQRHSPSCDVDHCKNCGMQLLAGCCDTPIGPNVWTGIWPGTLECNMYGLWFIYNGQPTEDLNQLYSGKFKWDKEQQLWVRK